MFSHRTSIRTAAALLCAAALALPASAAELTAGERYCFSPGDFGEELSGICVTAVPEDGALLLGDRVVRSGDVLTAAQLAQLTFSPPESESDSAASMQYLPIGTDGLAPEAELVRLIGKRPVS